jgi:hypothetical protein
MQRRWFQFSLRTAIVMMLIAAVGIGVWVWWPYYRAGRALDTAVQNPAFARWAIVRNALIQDEEFRAEIGSRDWHIGLEIESQQIVRVILSHSEKQADRTRSFNCFVGDDNEVSLGHGMSVKIHSY